MLIKSLGKVPGKQTGRIVLPYPRDKHFVPRADTIDRIKEALGDASDSPRVALVGLGGVG